MHVYYGAEKLKMIDERMFVLRRLQSPLGMDALLGLAQEDARRRRRTPCMRARSRD
jgi:hypothetical protein